MLVGNLEVLWSSSMKDPSYKVQFGWLNKYTTNYLTILFIDKYIFCIVFYLNKTRPFIIIQKTFKHKIVNIPRLAVNYSYRSWIKLMRFNIPIRQPLPFNSLLPGGGFTACHSKRASVRSYRFISHQTLMCTHPADLRKTLALGK